MPDVREGLKVISNRVLNIQKVQGNGYFQTFRVISVKVRVVDVTGGFLRVGQRRKRGEQQTERASRQGPGKAHGAALFPDRRNGRRPPDVARGELRCRNWQNATTGAFPPCDEITATDRIVIMRGDQICLAPPDHPAS